MKKGKSYQTLLSCGIVIVLLFGSFFVNSETTQEMQCWGTLRDTYTYNSDSAYYNYEKEDPLTEANKEVTIWDVESVNNTISFRTDLWGIFLGMVHCESEEEYDEYREAWEYDNTTDSFRVTYRFNIENQELQFVNPVHSQSISLGPSMSVPVDPMELYDYLLMWYGGLGFTFLPVFHANFSFETDFEIYELAYPGFEISFNDTFKFKRKTFQGYSYEISYTFEDEIYSGLDMKDEIEIEFSYNEQGILYSSYYQRKHHEKSTGDYELLNKLILHYTIDSYDKELAVASSWFYGLSGIFVCAIIVAKRRRRLRESL